MQFRLQVLEAQMTRQFDTTVRFVEADLFALQGNQRTAAIDALTSGDALPFVLLDERVISTGSLDPDTIAQGIEQFIAEV